MRTIANLKIKNRIFLAPMEEINDAPFRILCKNAGAGLTYTGMIHPQSQQKIYLEDKPALQLFCTTAKGIRDFIKKYNSQVSLWDFNLGCSAKTARKHGFGSFLLKDLPVIGEILKTMKESTEKPITIKIRKSKNAFKILKLAEKYCDAVCVHPRTQEQGYGGEADIRFAEEIRKRTKLPVIYSGDIDSITTAKKLLKRFDYVMVGRKAIGNPNFFSDCRTKFNFKDYLALAEIYSLPFSQLKFQAMNFTKGKENAVELRLEIFKIKNIKELREFVNKARI